MRFENSGCFGFVSSVSLQSAHKMAGSQEGWLTSCLVNASGRRPITECLSLPFVHYSERQLLENRRADAAPRDVGQTDAPKSACVFYVFKIRENPFSKFLFPQLTRTGVLLLTLLRAHIMRGLVSSTEQLISNPCPSFVLASSDPSPDTRFGPSSQESLFSN